MSDGFGFVNVFVLVGCFDWFWISLCFTYVFVQLVSKENGSWSLMVECLEEISEVEYRTIRKDKLEEIRRLNLYRAHGYKITYYKTGAGFAYYKVQELTQQKKIR